MTCSLCGDKGLLKLWEDSTEIALCLCQAASWYRSDLNAGKHTGSFGWQLWCARNQVDPADVYQLEDVLNEEELRELGFNQTPAEPSREAALLALGKSPRGKL